MTSLFCFLLAACSDRDAHELQQLRFSGPTMGTEYHVSVIVDTPRPGNQDLLASQIEAQLASLNQDMSTYVDDSELSQLNRGPLYTWLTVSDDMFAVLALAQRISQESEGAFDITVGPLVDLWGFGPATVSTDQTPADDEIKVLLQDIGYQKLELDREHSAVKKAGNIRLDLSAIAKGYAADKVGHLLLSLGYDNFMVEVGGEVFAKGQNVRQQTWRIGIETPAMAHQGVQEVIAISDVGVATSGDYRNYFEVDGVRFSHTINPQTGKPITHNLASVTVIAPTAAEADAYATAINVLGFEQGKAMAEQLQLAVFFIVRTNSGFKTEMTTGFSQYLSQG